MPVEKVTIPNQSQKPISNVGTPILDTPKEKAVYVLGQPVVVGDKAEELRKDLEDNHLTLAELERIWGLTYEQLKGLSDQDPDIVIEDGLDLTELDEMVALKEEAAARMMPSLVGKSLEEVEEKDPKLLELFDKLWELAAKGKLPGGLDALNELMDEYNLDKFEMNGDSHAVFFGEAKDIASFVQALKDIELTLGFYLSSKEVLSLKEEERIKLYPKMFSRLCKARKLRVIRLADWEKGSLEALRKIAESKGKDANLDAIQLFKLAKEGELGEYLKSWAIQASEDWNKFLIRLLRELRNAVAYELDEDANEEQAFLTISKRVNLIAEVLEEGEKLPDGTENKRWKALTNELKSIFEGEKLGFDYEKFKEGTSTSPVQGGTKQ